MQLINLDDDIYYTIYDEKLMKYVMHTGTIREFINTFVETRYLKIYEFNFLGYGAGSPETAPQGVGVAHKE